jgi:3-hydroxyisobutyrate dehydrogenase
MPNVPSSIDYQGGFMVDLMKKDLGLAMATGLKSQ